MRRRSSAAWRTSRSPEISKTSRVWRSSWSGCLREGRCTGQPRVEDHDDPRREGSRVRDGHPARAAATVACGKTASYCAGRASPGQDGGMVLAPIKAEGSDSDPIYRWIELLERQRVMRERARLLYVAATRAKRELHLLGTVQATQRDGEMMLREPRRGSMLHMLWNAVAAAFEAANAGLDAWRSPSGESRAEDSTSAAGLDGRHACAGTGFGYRANGRCECGADPCSTG